MRTSALFSGEGRRVGDLPTIFRAVYSSEMLGCVQIRTVGRTTLIAFLRRLVSYLSAIAALSVNAFHFRSSKELSALLILMALYSAYVAVSDGVRTWTERPKSYTPGSASIRTYMCRWLSAGGRAAVFSRDLSWAFEGDTKQTVLRKARSGELVACVGRRTDEIKRLVAEGAEVLDYSSLNFEPKSRFTIIDYGKAGARIAIGIVEEGRHVIREYDARDAAILALATDLISMARGSAEKVT
jgi:hypothetical protein